MGGVGEHSCPTGYVKIQTLRECIFGAISLGFGFHSGQTEDLSNDNHVCFRCEGCDPMAVHLSASHGTAAKWLCKKEGPRNNLFKKV